jgi:hypothetical protein
MCPRVALGSGEGVCAREQGHRVTQSDQLIREIGDNSLGPAAIIHAHRLSDVCTMMITNYNDDIRAGCARSPMNAACSPVAATATPVSAAAEQQQDNDDDQDHFHGKPRSGDA